ncbi:MAG: branched-chain amino acid ABC transporter permease [Chloroflexota bacterium]|nr:branched-chain amino acid ABC transporter permease [Chloroflexota bacterium]
MDQFITTYGFLIILMMLQAVLALSLYLPLMAGQLSLATPGFFAIGGYVGAVLATNKFMPAPGTTYPEPLQSFVVWLASIFPLTATGDAYPLGLVLVEMVLAGILCGLVAIVIGLPALRLRGIYLALATIAFVEILRVLSLNLPITGGAIGIFGVPQPFPDDATKFSYIVIALPFLLLCTWFVYRLERSRVGRAFIALREDELAATAMGINPTYNKVLAFTMGAIMAGMCGALTAHVLNTWNARQGTFDASILILAYVIIGGSRTFLGPVMGGLLLTALPEVLRQAAGIDGLPQWLSLFLSDGRLVIYGFLIAFGVLLFPQGLITPDLFERKQKAATPAPVPATSGGQP